MSQMAALVKRQVEMDRSGGRSGGESGTSASTPAAAPGLAPASAPSVTNAASSSTSVPSAATAYGVGRPHAARIDGYGRDDGFGFTRQ